MVVGPRSRAAYRFDRFTLDPSRSALLAADGAEIALRPKSFALPRHLSEHAGRAVGCAEPMAAVWPGLHVTADSVVQCVGDIRRALGDEGQRRLRTVRGRGYLLSAAVSFADPAGASAAARGEQPGGDAAAPRPPANRPMVVVLPFEAIDHEARQDYFAHGLGVDLVTDLPGLRALHLVAAAGGGGTARDGGEAEGGCGSKRRRLGPPTGSPIATRRRGPVPPMTVDRISLFFRLRRFTIAGLLRATAEVWSRRAAPAGSRRRGAAAGGMETHAAGRATNMGEFYNHFVRLKLENTGGTTPLFETITASVSDSEQLTDAETAVAPWGENGVWFTSEVLHTDADTVYYEFRPSDPSVFTISDSFAIGFGFDTGYVIRAFIPNTGDQHYSLSWSRNFGYPSGLLDVQRYDNVSLLARADEEPGAHDTLAAGVQNNLERTGTWYIAPGLDDDSAGPAAPTDWDALAAKAQARSDEAGQWGLLTYDAGDGEWGHL